MTNSAWLDGMLNPQIKKDATLSPQGENREDHFERKVQANPWVNEILELDPVAVEAEYIAKLKQEAMILGKTAALDDVIADGVTPEEVINQDFRRSVVSLSDYALAEIVAGIRGNKEQNTSETFYDKKETAKKNVASNRKKVEEEVLEAIGESSQLDWQKAFKEYTKDATPAEAKEKDLFKSEVPEAPHNFDKPSEDKFKLPKDADKALPGNGREADERKEVTQEAGVLKKDIVEGTSKEASLKIAVERIDTSVNTCPVCKEKFEAMDKYIAHEKTHKEAHCGSCPGDPGMEQKGAPEEIEKDAAQNQAVIDAFLSGQGGAKSMNLSIVKGPKGLVLVNYETPIAYRSADGQTYLNNQKYSQTTSTIQNKIRNAAQGQIKEVSPQELEQVMAAPTAAEAPSAVPSVEPMATKTSSVNKEADACPVCGGTGEDMKNGQQNHMSCKACGLTYASASLTSEAAGAHEAWDVFLNGKEIDTVFYTTDPRRTPEEVKKSLVEHDGYDGNIVVKKASKEIKNHASKAEVINKVAELQKKAEVASPWIVTTDEQGNEIIARVEPAATNTKESEEDKKEEILK